MKKHFWILFFCLVGTFGFGQTSNEQKGWTHLELGAGNYGKWGTCHRSRHSQVPENSRLQYAVLFWTIDQLIERYGSKGTVVLNDLSEDFALFAQEKLQDHLFENGLFEIDVQVLRGNFFDLPQDRSFDTIHLKNPEPGLFFSPPKTRKMLQNWANCSKTGLFLFILYTDVFVPKKEKEDFFEKKIFYKATQTWDAVPYFYPNGSEIDHGRVFFIPPVF